ncbi:MAG: CHASE3 domain-containing protein, partial [Geminicoccaceae bacterium]
MRDPFAPVAQGRFTNSLSVRNRLIAGFAAVGFVLVAAIGATFWKVSHFAVESDRIANLQVPSAAASARMTNNVNASLAALRGWMLTGDESFKSNRVAVWHDIDRTTDELDRL